LDFKELFYVELEVFIQEYLEERNEEILKENEEIEKEVGLIEKAYRLF